MYNDKFEKNFSDFLDSVEYDKAEDALFAIARAAFSEGWMAAIGELSAKKT